MTKKNETRLGRVRLVSIVMPAYNAEAHLGEALASVLAQTHGNMEVLLMDNASTDGTAEIARKVNDPRLRTIRNTETVPFELNIERGLKETRGDYVAVYHADDVYEPDIVERQVDYLERIREAVAVFTAANEIDEHNKPIRLRPTPPEFLGPDAETQSYDFQQIFKAILRHYNFLVTPTAMVRGDLYRNLPEAWPQEEAYGNSSDLNVWLGLLMTGPVGILPEPLIHYRIHQGQLTSQRLALQVGEDDIFGLLQRYAALPEVAAWMEPRDWRRLDLLKHRDRCSRAIKLIVLERAEEARKLLGPAERKVLAAALSEIPVDGTRTFFKWWLLGLGLYWTARVPVGERKRVGRLLDRFWNGAE